MNEFPNRCEKSMEDVSFCKKRSNNNIANAFKTRKLKII
jgi:hypothetical protein